MIIIYKVMGYCDVIVWRHHKQYNMTNWFMIIYYVVMGVIRAPQTKVDSNF